MTATRSTNLLLGSSSGLVSLVVVRAGRVRACVCLCVFVCVWGGGGAETSPRAAQKNPLTTNDDYLEEASAISARTTQKLAEVLSKAVEAEDIGGHVATTLAVDREKARAAHAHARAAHAVSVHGARAWGLCC